MKKALFGIVLLVAAAIVALAQTGTFLSLGAGGTLASCPSPVATANIICSTSDKGVVVSNLGGPYVPVVTAPVAPSNFSCTAVTITASGAAFSGCK